MWDFLHALFDLALWVFLACLVWDFITRREREAWPFRFRHAFGEVAVFEDGTVFVFCDGRWWLQFTPPPRIRGFDE